MSQAQRGDRGWWLQLAAVMALALALRLGFFFAGGDLQLSGVEGDDSYFDAWAWSIAQGRTLVPGVFYLAPLYPYLVASLYTVFGHEPSLVEFLQHLLGALNCALVVLLGRAAFGTRVGLAAGTLMAGYGLLIFYEGLLLKPTLALFLVLLGLLLLVWALQRRELRLLFVGGVVFGLSALVRGNMLLVLPFVFAGTAYAFRGRRSLALAVVVTGAVLALLPVTFRNFWVGNDFVVSTYQGGTNFYMGNNPDATGVYTPLVAGRERPPYEEEDAVRLARLGTRQPDLAPSGISNYWFGAGFRFIAENPGQSLRLAFEKLRLALDAAEIPDIVDFEEARALSIWLRVPLLNFAVLGPLGLLGLVFLARRENPAAVLLALYCGATLFSVCVFYVFARYRLPMIPVLLIFAAAFVDDLWRRRRQLLGRRGIAVLGAAVIAVFVVNNGAANPYVGGTSTTNRALLHVRSGDFVAAEAALRAALETNPADPHLYIGLGKTHTHFGRTDTAVAAYERAIVLLERRSRTSERIWIKEVRLELSRIFLRGGDFEGSELHTQWAVSHFPEDIDVVLHQGVRFHARGDVSRAEERFEAALEIDRDHVLALHNLALILAEKNELERAEQLLSRAQSLAPEHREIARSLDRVRRSRAEKARSRELGPDGPGLP